MTISIYLIINSSFYIPTYTHKSTNDTCKFDCRFGLHEQSKASSHCCKNNEFHPTKNAWNTCCIDVLFGDDELPVLVCN